MEQQIAGANRARLPLIPILGMSALLAIPIGAYAAIEEVIVTARRMAEPLDRVPAAVSVISQEALQLGQQQLGLDEALARVPGVFFQNRYNFAQDLRISIRGFGSRAAFGIRGVKLYIDDVPATTPDGQGGVDDIDLGSMSRVEVLRGPASALYGAAAGGVINLYSESGTTEPFLEARFSAGEYDSNRYQLKMGGEAGQWSYFGSVSYLDVDGYRDQSATENLLVNGKIKYQFDDTLTVTGLFSVIDSPMADDPGALTAAEVAADRRQARARNVQFATGEALDQQRVAIVIEKQIRPGHDLKLRGFTIARDFETQQPTAGTVAASDGGWVTFDRAYLGGGVEYNWSDELFGHANRLTIGVDIESQDDDRQRYVNANGVQGALTFDQDEMVDSYGFFLQDQLALHDALSVTAGLRYDIMDFAVDDRFLLNTFGNDSGSRNFEELSPAIGVIWSPREWFNVYGNISSSFETPTLTEFGNPLGGGFNPDLDPQVSTNYEVGVKGLVNERVHYEIALYTIETKDELIPFEQTGTGRVFFENAGKSTRTGLETAVTADLSHGLTATVAYTYSDFEFDRFFSNNANGTVSVFDGNELPGAPANQLYAELVYRDDRGFYAAWDVLAVDHFFADNANTVQIDGYEVSNIRAGYDFKSGAWQLSPFIGVNNVFGKTYNTNIRLNAALSRYFEPAPGANVYGGLTVRHQF